jgi:hypothetical protein
MVVGAVGYLLAGNALALRRHRDTVDATAASTEPYIATRTHGRTVNFKGEDEVDGEEVARSSLPTKTTLISCTRLAG